MVTAKQKKLARTCPELNWRLVRDHRPSVLCSITESCSHPLVQLSPRFIPFEDLIYLNEGDVIATSGFSARSHINEKHFAKIFIELKTLKTFGVFILMSHSSSTIDSSFFNPCDFLKEIENEMPAM